MKLNAGVDVPEMKLPLFVPILTAFTARVAGREMAELLQSPAALARALTDTQTIVGHDGVLCLFDPTLVARACIAKPEKGSSLPNDPVIGLRDPVDVLKVTPLRALLETIQALRNQLPDSILLYATISGPGLLYAQLKDALGPCGERDAVNPDYVVDVIRNAVRSALELKADGIALIEQTAREIPSDLLRTYKMVRKLANFYDAGFLLFKVPAPREQNLEFHAHCVFELGFVENGIGLLKGQLEPASVSDVAPCSTTDDVPGTMTVEGLKSLLHKTRTEMASR